MDSEDLELFRASLRAATERHRGDALDAALDELGWGEALAVDPQAAIASLFDLQGRANTTSSALERVLAATLGLDPDNGVAVVLPALGTWDPPGSLAGDDLTIQGFGSSGLASRDTAVVVAGALDDKLTIALVATADLELEPITGVNPELGAFAVTGTGVPVVEQSVGSAAAWTDSVARGRLALAHELVGVSRTMLELAREHALDRIQFGKPISQFQAVRHRLAEALVAIETADSMVAAAWDEPTPLVASVAKSVAGRGARTTARHCQQVLAGIGFTTEHDFHLYLRRFLVLDQLLGSTRSLTHDLGVQVIADRTRTVPEVLPSVNASLKPVRDFCETV